MDDTRCHEMTRLELEEQELMMRQNRLKLEEDEIMFRRHVLNYQCQQFFGVQSMKMLSEACVLFRRDSSDMRAADIHTTNKRACKAEEDNVRKRVRVWWKGDKRYYTGEIVRSSNLIKYDDGEILWESCCESEEEDEKDHASQKSFDFKCCNRTPGCPKPDGHVGRCPKVERSCAV